MSISSDETTRELISAFIQLKKIRWEPKSVDGYNPSEVRMLLCIAEEAKAPGFEMKVSDISKKLRVTTSSITQLLNKLEKDGLVNRRMDSNDRRVVLVKLTEAGEIIANKARANFVNTFTQLSEHLGEKDSQEMTRMLNEVYTFFKKKLEARSDV